MCLSAKEYLQRWNIITEAFKQGISYKEIAANNGIPYYAIRYVSSKMGIKSNWRAKRNEQFLEAIKQGMTYKEVVTHYDIPIQTVYNIVYNMRWKTEIKEEPKKVLIILCFPFVLNSCKNTKNKTK